MCLVRENKVLDIPKEKGIVGWKLMYKLRLRGVGGKKLYKSPVWPGPEEFYEGATYTAEMPVSGSPTLKQGTFVTNPNSYGFYFFLSKRGAEVFKREQFNRATCIGIPKIVKCLFHGRTIFGLQEVSTKDLSKIRYYKGGRSQFMTIIGEAKRRKKK